MSSPPTPVAVERRLYRRHRAHTRVQVRCPGRSAKMCRAANLSANGVAVITEDMSLSVGSVVELSFAIDLGTVVKIHRRNAEVKHIHNGVTGFRMMAFDEIHVKVM